ncbi:MAG: FliA/WhiG family RNA polymerase sigma factor [Anaeromyxobacteraceae bacterium]
MNRALRYGTAGSDSERELVQRYGPLLDRCARRLSARTGRAVAPDDLWSAGAMGLIEAARRYDATRDVKFETFVEHRIRGAMLDEMRRMDHLPRRLRADIDKVERERARLSHALGREPAAEEIAGALNLPLEDVFEVLTLVQPSMPVPEELPQPDSVPADEALDQAKLRGVLTTAIQALPERLQILLALYYDEGLTYREIAKILQVSEPRVCQLHSDAVKRLRAGVQGG